MATQSPGRETRQARRALRTLVIAIGNPLRGDDAVAHRVAESLGAIDGVAIRQEQQLTPELAAELVPFESVVFLDADVNTDAVTFAPLRPAGAEAGSHHRSPASVVALAADLYGWGGTALVCRLPAQTFEAGAPLSPAAAAGSRIAAALLASYLRS